LPSLACSILADRLGKPNITSPIQLPAGDVLLVNRDRLIMLIIATFICLTVIPMYTRSAGAVAPIMVADRPVVPLWNVGGKVALTVSDIPGGATYYVWVQRPGDSASRYTGIQLVNSENALTVPVQVTVLATDPAGTYSVSLSNTISADSQTAISHFGVYGTDNRIYQRTNKMRIAGGGFAPNSTVSVNVQLGSQPLKGSPIQVTAGLHGDFGYVYSVPPSAPAAAVAVSANGLAYDSHNSTTVSTEVTVEPTTITLKILSQPAASQERTANATIVYSITYPDNSPVRTSTPNSTRVFVVSGAAVEVAVVSLSLSDANVGLWQSIWVPPPSMKLARYHFEIYPANFDDSYGNVGTGSVLASQTFQLTPAKVQLILQGNTVLQRTEIASLEATALYHNGLLFTNVTQVTGTVTEPNATARPVWFNSTLNRFVAHYNTTVSSNLGQVLLSARITDMFNNSASGSLVIQLVRAKMNFAVNNAPAERTTNFTVRARITYPSGSVLTPDMVPTGFNVTVSKGNFTWTARMNFDSASNEWLNGYLLPVNATLGDYTVNITLLDRYGNAGNFSTSATVIPASFRFYLPEVKQQTSPGSMINVLVVVSYPNGSSLSPRAGGVVDAVYTNSSGTFNLPLIFNATDRTWHLFFVAPDPGLRFGLTIPLSFTADDPFGNTGFASQAFELDVGAGSETLILVSIIGAIPAIALVGWAFATISARRRKYKP